MFIKNNIVRIEHDAKAQVRKSNRSASYGGQRLKSFQWGSALKVDSDWTVIPGKGRFKFITSDEGTETTSIQLRDGFYILGARDANGGFRTLPGELFHLRG